MHTVCPKCAYVRTPEDSAPAHECPKCGIIYAKFSESAMPVRRVAVPAQPAEKRPTLCRECGERISPRATTCPHCGDPRLTTASVLEAAAPPESFAIHDITIPIWQLARFIFKWTLASIPTALAFGLVIYIASSLIASANRPRHPSVGTTSSPSTPDPRPATAPTADLDPIERRVALDAEQQYAIAERQGNATDICVQAGMVAAAWLQAKNESRYQSWKQTEHRACLAAGLPEG